MYITNIQKRDEKIGKTDDEKFYVNNGVLPYSVPGAAGSLSGDSLSLDLMINRSFISWS